MVPSSAERSLRHAREVVIEIKLTQRKTALIDEIDSDLANIKWFVVKVGKHNTNYYAASTDRSTGERKRIHMHLIILERILGRPLKEDECADHINHNGIDNRRSNLHICGPRKNHIVMEGR
ncbi:MAG: hypothetical protein WBN94_10335 [Methanothrix sp.]